jgi:hypothetical protein
MFKYSFALLPVLLAACSGGGEAAQQQRIAELEQQNAKLEGDLKQAKSNVEALKRALSNGGSYSEQASNDEPAAGPVVPAPTAPEPSIPSNPATPSQAANMGGPMS